MSPSATRPCGMLTTALYYLLPNMAMFDVKNAVVHAQPVPSGYLVTTTLYGLCYIVALVAAGVVDLFAAGLQVKPAPLRPS